MTHLPVWDLTQVYPSPNSPEFKHSLSQCESLVEQLESHLNLTQLTPVEYIEGFLTYSNSSRSHYSTLQTYLYCLLDTDSTHQLAKSTLSQLEPLGNRLSACLVTFTTWLLKSSPDLEHLQNISEQIKHHYFYLKELLDQGKFLMSPDMEKLADDLSLSGWLPWHKLQTALTSQLQINGLPLTEVLGKQWHDPNPKVRHQAYQAELKAWKSLEVPLAASLNSIKGTTVTLNKYRHRPDPLQLSLDQGRITPSEFSALMDTLKANLPALRQYLHHKAKLLGRRSGRIRWYDLRVPLSKSSTHLSWSQAVELLHTHLSPFSPKLKQLITDSVTLNWIDAQPRTGKRAGAYCTRLSLLKESRILLNYTGSLDDVLTLAHELGHAYHNTFLLPLPPTLRNTPKTLAETASTFNETLMFNRLLKAHPSDQLSLLALSLDDKIQILIDIYCRYLFESRFLSTRSDRELAPAEINALMLACQTEAYGASLDPNYRHPYMWTWKPHYFDAEEPFYNYPYAFGLLFALSLFSQYLSQGNDFLAPYEQLLSATGRATPAHLATRFGLDLSSSAFWQAGINLVLDQIQTFCHLSTSSVKVDLPNKAS